MAGKILVITGPTASGKTKLSIALAKLFGGEIVSADSMQIYKYMDIGTAKPDEAEKDGVIHHMMDMVSPFENYSVSRYVDEASKVTDDILSRGKLPIITGGTGLYIDSLISGAGFMPDGRDGGVREKYSRMYDELGGQEMLARLGEFDKKSAEKLHFNDKKRIVRAFEVYHMTGESISDHNERTKAVPPRYDCVKIALSYKNRQSLYDAIDARVDIMVEKGLKSEVEKLLAMGLDRSYTSMQAIGYKEILSYLDGEISFDEAVDIIKMESRRYAKRQLSWLRRQDNVHWILWEDPPNFESGIRDSTQFLENFGIIMPYIK